MTATVNGRPIEVDPNWTVLDLITGFNLKIEGVIASVNDNVVARNEWQKRQIEEGDCIELVSLVGGG